jgi:hypothetical protein
LKNGEVIEIILSTKISFWCIFMLKT